MASVYRLPTLQWTEPAAVPYMGLPATVTSTPEIPAPRAISGRIFFAFLVAVQVVFLAWTLAAVAWPQASMGLLAVVAAWVAVDIVVLLGRGVALSRRRR
jgi:hypothetical protein